MGRVPNSYTKAWIAWGTLTLLGFGVIETRSIVGDSEGPRTLSAHLRLVFGFSDEGPLQPVRRGLFYALWGWFGLHILSRATRDAFPD